MPHFIVGNTFPGLAVEAITGMSPFVSKAACNIGPLCNIQALCAGDDAMTDTWRQQTVWRLPWWVTFLHPNTRVYWIPGQQSTQNNLHINLKNSTLHCNVIHDWLYMAVSRTRLLNGCYFSCALFFVFVLLFLTQWLLSFYLLLFAVSLLVTWLPCFNKLEFSWVSHNWH